MLLYPAPLGIPSKGASATTSLHAELDGGNNCRGEAGLDLDLRCTISSTKCWLVPGPHYTHCVKRDAAQLRAPGGGLMFSCGTGVSAWPGALASGAGE